MLKLNSTNLDFGGLNNMSNERITRKIINKKGEEIEIVYNKADASQIEEFMFIDNPETGETTFRNGIVIKNIDKPQDELEEEAKLELVIEGKYKDEEDKDKQNEEIDDGR